MHVHHMIPYSSNLLVRTPTIKRYFSRERCRSISIVCAHAKLTDTSGLYEHTNNFAGIVLKRGEHAYGTGTSTTNRGAARHHHQAFCKKVSVAQQTDRVS